MDTRIEETYAIMDRAVEKHKPSTIIASYSGGYDSMVMVYIANKWAQERGVKYVAHAVDTRISANGWRDYVTESAKQIGTPAFSIWDNPDLDLWIEDVKKHGFAYNEAQHPFYFFYLKQRAFREMVAHYKLHYHDRVMFLNGIRRDESRKRRNAPEVARYGSGVHVNPVLYWTGDNILDFRTKYNLPVNPYYDTIGNSGDCTCNWHTRFKLSTIKKYATKAAEVIVPLDAYSRDHFGYGYGENPKTVVSKDQLRLFDWDTTCTPNLCDGCNKPDASNDAADFLTFQRMEW